MTKKMIATPMRAVSYTHLDVYKRQLWIIDNKDEARKNAAWEFVKYASSPEAQAAWMQGTGYFATNVKSYEIESMKTYLEENPNFTTAINQLHNTPTNEFTSGALLGVFPEARAKFEENMELVLMGQQTPEAVSYTHLDVYKRQVIDTT